MPPLFLAGEVLLPQARKEYVWELSDVGINGSLMLGFFHVCITEEFPIFDVPFNAVVGGFDEA